MTHLTISNGFILDLICSTKDVGLIQTRPRPIVPESMQKNWENEMACQSNTHTHTHTHHTHTHRVSQCEFQVCSLQMNQGEITKNKETYTCQSH